MPEIVVIGGGISGLGVAKKLAGKGHNVTVINSTPYFEWPIAGSYSLTHPEELTKALSSQGHFIPKVNTVVGTAVGIADSNVRLQDGRSVAYDALVIAAGFECKYFKPRVGQSWADRKAEVKKIGEALRAAQTVLIGGGGTIAIEFAGDVREVNKTAKIVVVTRGAQAMTYLNGKYSARLQKVLTDQRIEILANNEVDETEAVVGKKGLKLKSGATVDADVFIPAYSGGSNASFSGLANERGEVVVNDFLQAEGNPKVFAVGCSNREFSAVAKLMGQMDTVSANVLAQLSGKPLSKHKENMPTMTHPLTQKIGHYTYGWIEYELAPAPLKMMMKCCGFPFWGSCCCYTGGVCCPPCHPCACGVCCGEPHGSGTMAALRIILHGTGQTGIKLDRMEPVETGAPTQQVMGGK